MHEGILFWNVDTQFDFIEPTGKLYVKSAEKLKPVLKKITNFAAENHIRVINTCDFHLINSSELSKILILKRLFPNIAWREPLEQSLSLKPNLFCRP